MKSKYRRYTLFFLLLPALFLLCFVLSDPFGVLWRKEPKVFSSGGMRIMAANAVNSGKFNSYILGTSMTDNTSARDVEKAFPGSKFANVSIEGSSFFERSFPLSYMCKRGAKNVIYSLDMVYLAQTLEHPDYPLSNFAYLYDSNRLNNLKVYFSMTALRVIGGAFMRGRNSAQDNTKDFNMPGYWYNDADRRLRFGGLDKWFSIQFKDPVIGSRFRQGLEGIVANAEIADPAPLAAVHFTEEELSRVEAAKDYCREYVIKYVEENPSTQFYVFFPPYSRIRFATWFQCEKATALVHQEVTRYFAEMGAKYDNLYVFGFEDQAFLDDIALYCDTGHYHASINSLITAAMAAGTNLITPQNVGEYLRKAEARALAFDLKGLGKEIEERLRE